MKKTLQTLFICLCVALCLIPSLGMLFGAQTAPAGNEIQTKKPSLMSENGTVNKRYVSEWGDYFEKNFAFRSQIITADNRLMSTVFGVSDTQSVITGKNGWLYYTATLNDYLGKNCLNEAQAKALVQNLEILRDYAEQNGSTFLLTIAPNKNTLYGEHMPYYYLPNATAARNRDLLHTALEESDIAYCNLFEVFGAQTQTLYLKTDSHWDNRGALLAYNAILDSLGKPHEDFAAAAVERKKDFHGDLSNMLYPAASDKEYNYFYNTEALFSYVTDTKSTEEPFIQTKSGASGSLYMYRDSFGNALVPFFATAFESARFTKSFPMILENDLPPASADVVIFEIAERNIDWFLKMPPVLTAPEISVYEVQADTPCETRVEVNECEYSPAYIEISGKLEYDSTEGAPVYVRIERENGNARTFRCYHTLSADGEEGFSAYLKSADFENGETLRLSVLREKDNAFYSIHTQSITYGGNP